MRHLAKFTAETLQALEADIAPSVVSSILGFGRFLQAAFDRACEMWSSDKRYTSLWTLQELQVAYEGPSVYDDDPRGVGYVDVFGIWELSIRRREWNGGWISRACFDRVLGPCTQSCNIS